MGGPGRIQGIMCAAAAGLLSLGGCGERDGPITELRLAHGLPPTHPVHHAMEVMAEKVAELSDDSLTISIYPGGQLGSEAQTLELMQTGTLDIAKVSAAAIERFVPAYKVLNLPYIFRDEQHMYQVLEGAIGREIMDAGDEKSLHGLCFYDAGTRSLYTIDTPVHTPADLVGLKIRVQPSPTAQDLIRAFGGAPVSINWGELYTALQTGMVDGAENNPPSIVSANHHEVIKYYCLNQHTAVPDVLVVSGRTWARLTETQREWLHEAALLSAEVQKELWRQSSDEALRQIAAAGVEIIRPDRAPFAEAVRPMLEAARSADAQVGEYLDRIAQTQ